MSNLKATDLRIGNLIYYANGSICKVDYHQIRYLRITTEKVNYQPIPITEQWLLDFGFDLYPSGSYCIDLFTKNDYLAIDIKYNKGFIYINIDDTSLKINLEHLHQLQNLYFALTNEELTLNK